MSRMLTHAQRKLLRIRGERDYRQGLPITAWHDVALPKGVRHMESYRADYEMGWRGAKREAQA